MVATKPNFETLKVDETTLCSLDTIYYVRGNSAAHSSNQAQVYDQLERQYGGSKPPLLKLIAGSKAFQALLLVILANFLLVTLDPFKNVDPDSLPTMKSWVFWTTQDYLHQPAEPKVVLLGSSLLMNSVWMQEAEHTQKNVDIAVNHRTTYMESVLAKALKSNAAKDTAVAAPKPTSENICFNFGLPGAMVSDDYMVVRTLFKPQHTPKVAVLFLGPRDLMDTSFSCAGATTHFKYLERFTDTKDLLELSYQSAWPKINFLLREWIYFVGKKWHAQISTSEEIKQLLAPMLPYIGTKSRFNEKSEFDKQFAFNRSEVEKGVFIAKPNAQVVAFFDNGKDWRKRFKNSNDKMFVNQLTWLNMTIALLKAKGVEPVIVNLPVSQKGMTCMPGNIYARHVETLRATATAQNITYMDCMQEGKFEEADFTDYSHMDASGGKKIIDIAVAGMLKNPKLKNALADFAPAPEEKRNALQ